jgi:hypothetical protein
MEKARCALTRVFATWAVLRTHLLSVPTDSRLLAALNAVPAHIKARLAQEVENTEAAFDLLSQAVRSARIPDLRQAIYGAFARMMEGLPGPALQPLLCKTAAIFSVEAAQDALLHLHFQRGKAMANAILSDLLSAGSALEIRSHYIAGRLPPLKTA